MLQPFRVCMCVMSLTCSQRMLKFKIIFASITLNRRFPSNRKTPSDTTVHDISSSHSSVWRHEVAKHTMFEDSEGKVARPFQNAITGRIPDPTWLYAIQHRSPQATKHARPSRSTPGLRKRFACVSDHYAAHLMLHTKLDQGCKVAIVHFCAHAKPFTTANCLA